MRATRIAAVWVASVVLADVEPLHGEESAILALVVASVLAVVGICVSVVLGILYIKYTIQKHIKYLSKWNLTKEFVVYIRTGIVSTHISQSECTALKYMRIIRYRQTAKKNHTTTRNKYVRIQQHPTPLHHLCAPPHPIPSFCLTSSKTLDRGRSVYREVSIPNIGIPFREAGIDIKDIILSHSQRPVVSESGG